MQRWEYKFVGHDRGKPRVVNGKEIPNWEQGPFIHDYANELGNEGWELIQITAARGDETGPSEALIFKRPKE